MSQNSGDLRVRRTRKLLREAFLALVDERGFDAITVGEIAQRAMVSRAAFYRYYQDKYDMVEQIFEDAMHTLLRDINAYSHDVLGDFKLRSNVSLWEQILDENGIPEAWVRLFKHFEEYEQLYRVLLGGKGSSWFVTKMRAFLAERVGERLRELVFQPNRKQVFDQRAFPEELVSTVIAAQMVEAITWWLEQGRSYSARQVATYCHRLVFATFREASTWD